MKNKVFHTPEEISQLFQEQGLPKNFCIVPFTNLIFNPGGKVSVCRQKGTDHSIGHLDENSANEIWNNEYIQQWRKEFLTGDVKICAKEQARDACHLSCSNYHFFDDVKLTVKQEDQPLKITANLNGKCNLECKMCNIWKMENGYYDKNNFWENSEKDFFPFIKEIEFLSGEPFIQKDTYKLIDKISVLNPDCQWSFTTNSHWKLTPAIIEKLDKIKIKNIIISVDSLKPESYSEIRRKGSLDVVIENIDSMLSYNQQRISQGKTDMGLTLHFLAMKENFFETTDILDFCENRGLRHILRTLVTPENLSVLSLSQSEKINLLNNYADKASADHLKKSARVIGPLLESLTPIDKFSVLQKMYAKIT